MKNPTPLTPLLLALTLGMTAFTTAAAFAVTDTLHKSQHLAQMPEGIKEDASMKHQQGGKKGATPLSEEEREHALAAAKHAYQEETGFDDEADWNVFNPLPDTQYKGQPARLIQYKVYSPSHGTYDSVIVYVGSDGQVVGTEVKYLGR